MDETGGSAEDAERAFWQWLQFWAELLLLAVVAVLGAIFASRDAAPGDYAGGMILIGASLALGFLRLKYRLDGGAGGWLEFVLVERMRDLAIMLPLLALVALAGLFVAQAWAYGILHWAGVGLFVASGVLAFLDLKHVFDRIDSRVE